ncbi:MAG: Ig-like domain-containing protein [Desulfuromonadales bacterium]|nr:Ig-like domain-containing protein [Desulfuromonadales bacterium]
MQKLLTLFLIVLTAGVVLYGCGGGGGGSSPSDVFEPTPPPSTDPANPQLADLFLTADKLNVQTDGRDQVVLTVIAVTGANAALEGTVINLGSTAGLLSAQQIVTGADGKATFTFSAGAEKANQTADITASSGTMKRQIPISIRGSTLELNADKPTLKGDGLDIINLTGTLRDAGTLVIPNARLRISSSLGNILTDTVNVATQGTTINLTTDFSGSVKARLKGDKTGTDTISLQWIHPTTGAVFVQKDVNVTVSRSIFSITSPANGTTLDVSQPVEIAVSWLNFDGTEKVGKTITFNAGAGTLSASSALTDQSGVARVTFLAPAAGGPVLITASGSDTGDSGSATITLNVKPSTPTSLVLQAAPTILSPSNGTTASTSTITATVRDATNNPVPGAIVRFTLSKLVGGGEFISPLSAVTDSGGKAVATFTAGTAPSAKDQIEVTASVEAFPAVLNRVYLTIGQQPSRITFGETNVIEDLVVNGHQVGYKLPISLTVTDNNGNAVPNQVISLGMVVSKFRLGFRTDPDTGDFQVTGEFNNEDLNQNGILDPGEDGARGFYDFDLDGIINKADTDLDGFADEAAFFLDINEVERQTSATPQGLLNGRLDPGNVATIPAQVITNENGMTAFTIDYAKSYGNWVVVTINASTGVVGSESTATISIALVVKANDKPYLHSPFGF